MSEAAPSYSQAVDDLNRDEKISFLDLLLVIVKHKKLVLALPLAVAIVTAIVSSLMPNIYTATAKILPPQQNQSVMPIALGQLGALAGSAGSALGLKNPNDLYIGMLKSRSVADALIERFDLNKRYGQQHQSSTRAMLDTNVSITSGKDNLITIEYDDKDPKFAAAMANGYVDELAKLTQVLAVTEASKRRLFFERQFQQAKENLVKAEIAARSGLDQSGVVKVDEQGRAMIETTARLRGQMTVKEVQIGAMRSFAAENNPELRLAEQELESMKRELGKIEGEGTFRPSAKGSSGRGMDNLRLLRDVRYNEVVYELLARQYEVAKIEEAKDSAVVQVLDRAVEPDRKSRPKRAQLVVFLALVALFVAILWAFAVESLSKSLRDPQQARRVAEIRDRLSWRRR